ncbi:MAG: hypothetical protein OQK05_14590 [Pseudopelagicola sp.]|nr:hypothetical protein [Pseudopelagicola sp.]
MNLVVRIAETLRLSDFWVPESPDEAFEEMLFLLAWILLEENKSSPENDRHISGLAELTTQVSTLTLYLTRFSTRFVELSKRRSIRSLVRLDHELSPEERLLIAGILQLPEPQKSKPQLARNVVIILTVALGIQTGRRATQGASSPNKDKDDRSACGRISHDLRCRFGRAVSTASLQKTWDKRKQHLNDAGFPPDDVNDFLRMLAKSEG